MPRWRGAPVVVGVEFWRFGMVFMYTMVVYCRVNYGRIWGWGWGEDG
jgi:hypothetical protein